MAKLRNCLPHMAGQSVLVNGTRYQIDDSGIAEVDDKIAVDKLLQNRSAWSLVSGQVQAVPSKTVAPKPVEKTVEKTVETPTEKPVRKPVIKEVTVEVVNPKKKKEQPVGVDNGGVDWPDPTISMSIHYLRQLADAYAVEHTPKMSKTELVKRIYAAMYDEAE